MSDLHNLTRNYQKASLSYIRLIPYLPIPYCVPSLAASTTGLAISEVEKEQVSYRQASAYSLKSNQ